MMILSRSLGTLLLTLSALAALAQSATPYCIADRFSQDDYFDASEIAVVRDVVYGAAPRWPAEVVDTLRMDFYYPNAAADPLPKRPFIMLIHGGSFLGGSREDMRPMAEAFARRGFVVATMSYRLGWDCPPDAGLLLCFFCSSEAEKLKVAAYRSVQDGRAAMRYVVANADTYQIDTDALFIGGTSAGSIASIHTAYLSQADADAFCPACAEAIGPLDGQVNDLEDVFSIKGVINNCGAVVGLDILAEDRNIPVISFHDDNDCIVPSAFGHALGCFNCTAFLTGHGSQLIHQRLESQGGCSSLNLRTNSIGHCTFPAATVVGRGSCFIKRLLCGECPSEFSQEVNGVSDCSGLVGTESLATPSSLFTLYPNPTEHAVTLILSHAATDIKQVRLSNMWGQVLLQVTWTGADPLVLPLDGLAAGVYTVTLYGQAGQTETRRLVKQ